MLNSSVSRRNPEPSALTTQMCQEPLNGRVLANAIWLPSGDQVGSISSLLSVSGVTRRSSVPCALMTWMLGRPPAKLWKAI